LKCSGVEAVEDVEERRENPRPAEKEVGGGGERRRSWAAGSRSTPKRGSEYKENQAGLTSKTQQKRPSSTRNAPLRLVRLIKYSALLVHSGELGQLTYPIRPAVTSSRNRWDCSSVVLLLVRILPSRQNEVRRC
jgi:hypothetical protein